MGESRVFSDVEELATACKRLDKANNTYFAISSFCTKENRKQENVNKTKVIAIDVDCGKGKPFADWRRTTALQLHNWNETTQAYDSG